MEDKKINIYSYNVKKALEFDECENITAFINKLLEKYFEGEVIVITRKNYDYFIPFTSEDMYNKPIQLLINDLLEKIELEAPRKEKLKVTLDQSKPVTIKKGERKPNFVNKWD